MLLSTCLPLNCDTQECFQTHMHTLTRRFTLSKGNPCLHKSDSDIHTQSHTASPAMPLTHVSLFLVKQVLEKDLIVSGKCTQTLRRQCVYSREELHTKRENIRAQL